VIGGAKAMETLGDAAADLGIADRIVSSASYANTFVQLERDILALIAESAPASIVLDALVLGLERHASPGTLASLQLFDESLGIIRHGAAPSLPQEYTTTIDGCPIGPAAGSCGTAAYRRERVIVTDIATDPLWADYRAAALAWGLRACWSQPIFSISGAVLGTLAFYYREARSPSAADLASIDAAARVVRIVVDRQRIEIAQSRASRREAAQFGAARALAESNSVDEALAGVLEAVGRALDLDTGGVWLLDPELTKLMCTAQWARQPERVRHFIEDTATRVLAPGEGLPGRVFERGTAEWTAIKREDSSFVRTKTATEAGLRSGFALPIVSGRETVGAIEFLTSHAATPDADLLRALRTVGLQVGQFVRSARVQAERERLVAQLQETVRYTELFQGVLGHDLRNPLHAMMMGTALLQLRARDERTRATLARIDSSGRRMARMIDQLLDVARCRNGGGIPVMRKPTDLGALARSVVGEIMLMYPQCSVTVETVGDLRGSWDEDRLCQVLSNLLSNAVQHGDPGRSIELRIDGRDASSAVVDVRSAGSIADDHLPSLFAPFKRCGEKSSERAPHGVGLGLYITQQIVLAHRGGLTVFSGESGTTFRMELPRA